METMTRAEVESVMAKAFPGVVLTIEDMWYCSCCEVFTKGEPEDLTDGGDTCGNCGETKIEHCFAVVFPEGVHECGDENEIVTHPPRKLMG